MRSLKKVGSVRVDLLGGTLDIYPINVVLDEVVTINCATSIFAEVEVLNRDDSQIILRSKDYNQEMTFSVEKLKKFNFTEDELGPLKFLLLLLKEISPSVGLEINLKSMAPTGSGLGGSSSMGSLFFKTVSDFLGLKMKREHIVEIVQRVESKVLNQGPAGYQDYYPSLFGGVLALEAKMSGVSIEQLFTSSFKKFLEENVSLIYSGESRDSGINNWEVYKRFFDRDKVIREGLTKIRDLSRAALNSLRESNFEEFLCLLSEEGKTREGLFSGIMSQKMKSFKEELSRELDDFKGTKVCGAGGGGCFLVISKNKSVVYKKAEKFGMSFLPFEVQGPVGEDN